MKFNCTVVASALSALMLAACSTEPEVVENPLIESSNSMTLDVSKVELTDTATVLHVDAYFWMPESGEASFVLSFQPLPKRTKSFDFIESDCADCFKLFGIDLTGKKDYDVPEGIPAEALSIDEDAPMPEPIFKSGETTVEVHLLHHREELGKEQNLYVNTLAGGQEEYTASIDLETGVATFKFQQYGTAEAFFPMAGSAGSVLLAPGEHVTVYIDSRFSGQQIVARRKEQKMQPFRKLYTNGTYANLNNLINSRTDWPSWSMNLYSGEFADYKMGAKEYEMHVINRFQALSDSIEADTLPPLMKEWMQISLRDEAVVAMLDGNFYREHNYRCIHNDWNRQTSVKGIEPMKQESLSELGKLFDINDPKLLMGAESFGYIGSVVHADEAWIKAVGIQTGLIPSLRKFVPLIAKTQAGTLAEADLKVFGTEDNPFYADALRAMQQETVARLEALKDKAVIEQTPDVSVEKLFDEIIAPYKGKVVFVDFWNTWCGPCRMSIKATEPLKDTELKSDDLVWIYIANETSPLVKYQTMIPDIKGKHFRLNDKQWEYLSKKFKIDGIPSYVLVDKDGSYSLRNDLRDHNLLVKTLQEKIGQQ